MKQLIKEYLGAGLVYLATTIFCIAILILI